MSQSERKFLTAKRHTERLSNRPSLNSSSYSSVNTNTATKRNHDSVETDHDQPPSKRPNRHSSYQTQSRGFESYGTSTKNLAERRMQNLRKSLQENRARQSGGNASFTPKSPNVPKKPEPVNLNASSSVCSSPLLNRQKRKNSENSATPRPVFNMQSVTNNQPPSQPLIIPLPYTPPPNVQSPNVERTSVNNEPDEFMEWNEIDETTVINDINELRREIDYNKELPSPKDFDKSESFTQDGCFIVVDTNVFLSQLHMLTELKEIYFKGFGRATIVVPWMVIQELDYMKESHSSRSMVKAARKAVHFINMQLASKDSHFTGQSVIDASKLEMCSKNPDDGIIFSCMQLIEKGKFVILLSNDVNLRNKALINKIQSYSSTELIPNLNNLKSLERESKMSIQSVQKIKILISNLLTHIIEYEMKNAYGDIWLKMANLTPPLTTDEALGCLQKYWVAVFSCSLQKQCKQKIDEFITFQKSHRSDSSYKSEDFTKFVELSLSLCIYLKNGYTQHLNLVKECVNNIQKCAAR